MLGPSLRMKKKLEYPYGGSTPTSHTAEGEFAIYRWAPDTRNHRTVKKKYPPPPPPPPSKKRERDNYETTVLKVFVYIWKIRTAMEKAKVFMYNTVSHDDVKEWLKSKINCGLDLIQFMMFESIAVRFAVNLLPVKVKTKVDRGEFTLYSYRFELYSVLLPQYSILKCLVY